MGREGCGEMVEKVVVEIVMERWVVEVSVKNHGQKDILN